MGARVSRWGPYRIEKELYDRALTQEERLRSGRVLYKAVDRNYRPQASNCIHAVSDIDTDNGLFHVGREWGDAASRDVANHLRRWVNNPEKTYPWVSERLEPRDFPIEGQRLDEVRPEFPSLRQLPQKTKRKITHIFRGFPTRALGSVLLSGAPLV